MAPSDARTFIRPAEESGLIATIGEWVLNEACRQAESSRRAGLPPNWMSVNVSARRLRERRLTAVVAGALGESGLDANLLEMKLTESMSLR
ncbi:EAL domain-containing protein [Roseiarcus sp.]|uniref:EAL domain-containing protein n=1 Tax=Roseiarcus sp. TaxID=1969460 RepID=UPI003F9BCF67